MSTWHFVDKAGRPTGATFSGPKSALKQNTPSGCRARAGLSAAPIADTPERRRMGVLDRIAAIEQKKMRPLGELAIDPANEEARQRLVSIEAALAQLRSELRAGRKDTSER